ncbi:hypothetical protein LZ575_11350 [Antarcticibacterium sp. 1MA-6-2]|uniref:hypothetical protein n=1 Tax=Antarcticibacterium sp. 1MA-6-2 TaxID=2908210 RepID=UPI001F33B703|nr:hypothetical protein [Antarcticibacterium sp. 1MA-6-2]UJH89677.1 hypothetical protein LZ575_11350 [Antarcticibacterium sp. 1MA-6-2]
MKKKLKKREKYKAIISLLENRKDGLQPIPECRKNLKKVSLTVEDHADYMMRISALLEVCVIALDGQGSFSSKSLSHITGEASIGLVLEMVIDLLPYDQMNYMDRIEEIIDKEKQETQKTNDISRITKLGHNEKKG